MNGVPVLDVIVEKGGVVEHFHGCRPVHNGPVVSSQFQQRTTEPLGDPAIGDVLGYIADNILGAGRGGAIPGALAEVVVVTASNSDESAAELAAGRQKLAAVPGVHPAPRSGAHSGGGGPHREATTAK